MEIRLLTEADAALYRPLRLEALQTNPDAFGSSYEETLAQPLAVTVARFQAHDPAQGSFTLGAFEGDLIGVVTLVRHNGLKNRHKADLVAMYVTPAARGRGVGRALIEDAIRRERQVAGLEQILLTVTATNAPARHLYEALGFTVYGREPRALKLGDRYLDEDLMILRL